MILVERNRPDPSSESGLIKPSASWFELAERATERAIAEGREHQVSGLYRDSRVRTALEALFHGKCAYCESRMLAASSWDVEHYRPKGRVAKRPDHPGYYWLAYVWLNLYLACMFCNQSRRDAPLWNDPRTLPVAGKGDQFPLEDETKRAMSPLDDLGAERPLLLDPCASDDDPENHLTYDNQGLVHPRDSEDRRAGETIRICHLNRRRLRDERIRTLAHVVEILESLRLARDLGHEGASRSLEQLLAHYLADEAPYAGIAREVVRDPEAF